MTTELRRELGNYRRQMGLCPTPQTKENTPLVLALDTALQLANKNQHSAISSIGADTSISERQTIALKPLTRASIHYLVDRKSTRLNSSHVSISYAVFCLKKKILHNIISI